MSSSVCVDSGLLIKLLLQESDSERVRALWQEWGQAEMKLVAPTLFAYEVTAVLRKSVYRGLLKPEEAQKAFELAQKSTVELLHPDDLNERAWKIATRLNRPTAYDSYYLALAEKLDCEFWTADERLYRAVKNSLNWVKWIGESQS